MRDILHTVMGSGTGREGYFLYSVRLCSKDRSGYGMPYTNTPTLTVSLVR